LHTDAGRLVYGGGGITPDIEMKAPETGAVRGRLFYGAFHFVRQLAAGQIANLREYRISEAQYKTRLVADDINRYPSPTRWSRRSALTWPPSRNSMSAMPVQRQNLITAVRSCAAN